MKSLLNLISYLDLECSQELAMVNSYPYQIIARALIALAYADPKHLVIGSRTLDAAEIFAIEPTPENYYIYAGAATNTYPFGPGDGCLSVEETGYSGCNPGSGCRSGSGSLYQFTYSMSAPKIMSVSAKELIPWLKDDTNDPVAIRWANS